MNKPNPGVQRLTITTPVSGPTAYAVVFDDGSSDVPSALTPLDEWRLDDDAQPAVKREPVVTTPAANPCKGIVGPTTTTSAGPGPATSAEGG